MGDPTAGEQAQLTCFVSAGAKLWEHPCLSLGSPCEDEVTAQCSTSVQWEWWCWVPRSNVKHNEKVMPISLLSGQGPAFSRFPSTATLQLCFSPSVLQPWPPYAVLHGQKSRSQAGHRLTASPPSSLKTRWKIADDNLKTI